MGIIMGILEIDERGRITIPKEEREKLGLKPGEKIVIRTKDNELIIKKLVTIDDFITNLRGCIQTPSEETDPLKLKSIWGPKI